MKDIDKELIAGLIHDGVMASEDWKEVEQTDPCFRAERAKLDAVMDRLTISPDLMEDLTDAVWNTVFAANTAAVLYGMRVAFTILEATAAPAEISRYMMEN